MGVAHVSGGTGAGSFDKTVAILNIKLNKVASIWKEHSGQVLQARFMNHIPGMLSCGVDCALKIWMPASGENEML